jgi:hypothetical protein
MLMKLTPKVRGEQTAGVKEVKNEVEKKFELKSRADLGENTTKSESLDSLAKSVEKVAETMSTVIATTTSTTPSLLMFLSNQGINSFFIWTLQCGIFND